MSYVTAHVLDSATGTPARGVEVRLETHSGEQIATAVTNDDGRVPELGPQTLESGHYRITFGTGEYFAGRNQQSFHPYITVNFITDESQGHYHVPLLLSPFAYTTYRGS